MKSQWKGASCVLAKVTLGGPPCHIPGAMEGREDEHVAQPRVLKGQGSTDHTSLVFSRGFGQWEDAGVPLPLEWEEPALGDGGGTVVGVFFGELEGRGRLVTQGCAGPFNRLTCASASTFDKRFILVSARRWAVTFT